MCKNQSGFTMVELVVSIALLGIVGTLLARFMFFSAHQNIRIESEIEATQAANMTLNYVTSEVKRHDHADGITMITYDGNDCLQIFDDETPFVIENVQYAYQWIVVEEQDVAGAHFENLNMTFGKDASDLANDLTTPWYSLTEIPYMKGITFDNIIYRTIEGKTILKSFDLVIDATVGMTSDIFETSITIRSEQ